MALSPWVLSSICSFLDSHCVEGSVLGSGTQRQSGHGWALGVSWSGLINRKSPPRAKKCVLREAPAVGSVRMVVVGEPTWGGAEGRVICQESRDREGKGPSSQIAEQSCELTERGVCVCVCMLGEPPVFGIDSIKSVNGGSRWCWSQSLRPGGKCHYPTCLRYP